MANHRAGVSYDLRESGKTAIVRKAPCRVLFTAEQADLGDYSRSLAEFLSYPCIRGVAAKLGSPRRNAPAIFWNVFFRNRPALELMRRVADEKANGSTLRIAVLACSIGAEVYSILWTIRLARPDLKVLVCAVDISRQILKFAEKGIYAPDTCELVGCSILERLTAHEMEQMFDWEGDQARIKPWLREGITWQLGDASSPELIHVLGPQDIVVASNFLCHMEPLDAENCLRNIAVLVDRGGYLFVSGVDLEVRPKVAHELGWRPIPELLKPIHDGDPDLRGGWPLAWWGLEPLNHRRCDWQLRYATAFQSIQTVE